jgi:hypothetical protein
MVMCVPLFLATIVTSMEHPAANFHDEMGAATQKPGLPRRPGFELSTT